MNIINTSNIIEPSQLQPFTGYSLEFIQNSTKEMLYSVVQGLIGNSTSTTIPYILWGCIKTNIGGSNYSYTQGYIMLNKEIYYFPGIASISITDTDVCKIIITPDSIADPLYFTNGNPYNVHDHRTIQLTNGLSGSGDFNFSQAVKVQKYYANLYSATGFTVNSASYQDFTSMVYTTPNDGVTRNYIIEYKSTYTTSSGAVDASSSIRIYNVTGASTLDEGRVGKSNFATSAVPTGSAYLNTGVVSLAPNTTIKVQGIQIADNVTFEYNRLSIVEYK